MEAQPPSTHIPNSTTSSRTESHQNHTTSYQPSAHLALWHPTAAQSLCHKPSTSPNRYFFTLCQIISHLKLTTNSSYAFPHESAVTTHLPSSTSPPLSSPRSTASSAAPPTKLNSPSPAKRSRASPSSPRSTPAFYSPHRSRDHASARTTPPIYKSSSAAGRRYEDAGCAGRSYRGRGFGR